MSQERNADLMIEYAKKLSEELEGKPVFVLTISDDTILHALHCLKDDGGDCDDCPEEVSCLHTLFGTLMLASHDVGTLAVAKWAKAMAAKLAREMKALHKSGLIDLINLLKQEKKDEEKGEQHIAEVVAEWTQ